MAKQLWEITVNGRVQGVGFRYFTQRAASGFDISGYSKNMPDGSVMLEVEGEVDELGLFCEKLEQGPGRVDGIVVKKKAFESKFENFDIRY